MSATEAPGKVVPLSRLMGVPISSIAICLVVVIANLGATMVAPVLPTIRDAFGSSAAAVSLMVSGFGLGQLAMDLPAGFLISRISPSKLLSAAILLAGGSSAMAVFATSIEQLFIFRTIAGIGSAIMSTVAMVVMVNNARPSERGSVLSLFTSAILIGPAMSPIIGGYLATAFGWRSVFVFCAITPIITFPLNHFATRRAASERAFETDDAKPTGEKAVVPSRRVGKGANKINWPALITVFVASTLVFFNRSGMQAAVLPLYAASVLGMGAATIGNILGTRALFTSLATLPLGPLADRIGKKQLLIPAILLGVGGNLYLNSGESMWIFTVSTFMISMTVVATNMISALVADLIPYRWLGRGMGMFRFACDLGMVVGPVVMGVIVDQSGFGAVLIVGAGMLMLAVVSCILLVPGSRAPAPLQGRADPEGRARA